MPFGRKKNKKVGSDQQDESRDPILLCGAPAADVKTTHDATGRPRYPTVGQLIVTNGLGEPLISERDTEQGEIEEFNPPSPDYTSREDILKMPITEESLEAVNGEWQGPTASILCPWIGISLNSDHLAQLFEICGCLLSAEDKSMLDIINIESIKAMDLSTMASEGRTQRTREEASRARFEKMPPQFVYDDPIGCCAQPSAVFVDLFPMLLIAEDGQGGFKSAVPASGKIPALSFVICCSPCLLACCCCLGTNCPGTVLPVSDEFVLRYEGRLEDRWAWCKDLSCGAANGTCASTNNGMKQPPIPDRQVITEQPGLNAAGRSYSRNLQQSIEEATIPDYLRLGINAEGFAEYLVRIGFLRKQSDKEVARILNFKGNEDHSDSGNEGNWSRQELENEFQLLARMPMLRYTFNPESVWEARKSESWIDNDFGKLKLDAVAEMSGKNTFFSKAWFDEAERVFPWFPGRSLVDNERRTGRRMIQKEFNWQRWWCVTGYDIGAYIK
jgi:hypothetical protein